MIFVSGLIMTDRPSAGAAARDDRGRSGRAEVASERVGVIAAIGDEPPEPTRYGGDQVGRTFTSLLLPGVRWITAGRPRTSVTTWSLVVCPPRETPMACGFAPLCRHGRSGAP